MFFSRIGRTERDAETADSETQLLPQQPRAQRLAPCRLWAWPAGSPVQPTPYPVQPTPYPVQPTPYPVQPTRYPAQLDCLCRAS